MKGVVFTEFFSLVEKNWSPDLVEDLIDEVDPPSGGVYTSVGTYDHGELVNLLMKLSAKTKMAPADLLHAFGRHLFSVFLENYRVFFENVSDPFDFLESIEDYIHVEVRKLYSDAELPTFESSRPDDSTIVLIYSSKRGFSDLAYGLISATCEHWETPVTIETESLPAKGDMQRMQFTIRK